MKPLQITLILSMGLVLFSAAVLPTAWVAVVCVVALAAVAVVARHASPDGVMQPKKTRRIWRTAIGMAVAIGLIVWALLSSGR